MTPPRLLALALAAALSASPAAAAPGGRLDRARVCYEALDYACARDELARARAEDPDAPDADAVLALAAEVALALGDRAAAVALLTALLDRAPRFEPPPGAWPPAWLAALEDARRLAPDRASPEVEVVPPGGPYAAGRAARVTVRVTDPAGVARAILHLAQAGEAPLTFALLSDGGALWHVDLPAELVTEPSLALWVEAWDRAGNGPGRWASAEAPFTLPVHAAPAASPPLTSRWWFWAAIGAVVVTGVVVAVALATRDDAPATATPAFGDARVVLDFP